MTPEEKSKSLVEMIMRGNLPDGIYKVTYFTSIECAIKLVDPILVNVASLLKDGKNEPDEILEISTTFGYWANVKKTLISMKNKHLELFS